MDEHMSSVIAFFVFFVLCALVTHLSILLGSLMPKNKKGIKVGDCLAPKHELVTYYEPTDIHALASAVHKESRK